MHTLLPRNRLRVGSLGLLLPKKKRRYAVSRLSPPPLELENGSAEEGRDTSLKAGRGKAIGKKHRRVSRSPVLHWQRQFFVWFEVADGRVRRSDRWFGASCVEFLFAFCFIFLFCASSGADCFKRWIQVPRVVETPTCGRNKLRRASFCWDGS
ncbi:hypothetical protein MRX96_012957 [Rhipicephalus microplus]